MDKLLVIEDSQAFSAILCSEIEAKYGMQTVPAYDFAQAKALLNGGDHFFLATIDLHLPDASEQDIVELVLSHDVPGIVFTTEMDSAMRTLLMNKGISDYVLKQGPYNIDYLIRAVGRLWRNRLLSVLVVNSDTQESEWYVQQLKRQLLEVVCVPEGALALQAIRESDAIDLVIVDLSEGGTNPYRLVSNIRADFPERDIRIIGISREEGVSSVHFIKSGADDFLRWPFQSEDLSCLVNRNLDNSDHLQQFKKVSAQKDKLLGMVAHDVRGPVGNILTAGHWLLNKDMNEERKQAFYEIIVNSSEDLLGLLNSLLDMSSINSGKVKLERQVRSLSSLVAERLSFFDMAATAKGIQFRTTGVDNAIGHTTDAYIDEKRFSQVIDNLVSNALKFSPKDGVVEILLSYEGESAKLLVRDQGEGIPVHEQQYLFSDYSRLSTRPTAGEDSTGLGLSVCKSVVDAHHGSIGLDSEYTEGAAFFVLVARSESSLGDN